jgi:hypothetical protein
MVGEEVRDGNPQERVEPGVEHSLRQLRNAILFFFFPILHALEPLRNRASKVSACS